MMKTAQAFEVGRVGGPTVGERDGVIQVALGGRAVATGRPTGQILARTNAASFTEGR